MNADCSFPFTCLATTARTIATLTKYQRAMKESGFIRVNPWKANLRLRARACW